MDKNFETVVKYLNKLFDEESVASLINFIGEDNLKKASYAMSTDTGMAAEGTMLEIALELCDTACKINEILPEEKRVNKSDIYRAGLLSQIAKSVMFTENDNDWEVKNRGFAYKFTNLPTALRMGERALYMLQASGLKIEEHVFEAIASVDKKNDDAYAKYYSTPLTVVLRQAAELVDLKYHVRKNG